MTVETTAQHEALIQSLMDSERWPQGGGDRQRIDTHISTVVLAGDVAYKLKKPLNLGFLDFCSLDARRRACFEELHLNQRLAPQIYQAVCAITGSIEQPWIDGDGEAVDWAVRMRRFDPDAILSRQMHRLDAALIESLAVRVARFHAQAAKADPDMPFGSARLVYEPMKQNFIELSASSGRLAPHVDALAHWTATQRSGLKALLGQRRIQGHIRECHGDLHLGNVALIDGEPVMFDAIEFNPQLRWIDTINDIAFMTMDLQQRGRSDLSYRFLDRYMQASGDYAGLALLRFYEVYRALVRAKIAAIRSRQSDLTAGERDQVDAELTGYMAFAEKLSKPRRGAVVITRGVSGSGKSHVSQTLPEFLPAVRLRSDVERKRIMGIDARADGTQLGAYSKDVTRKTYAVMAALASKVVEAGYVAVVDATFLKRAQRDSFRLLAQSLDVPFAIIDCDAPAEILRERILARADRPGNVSDADLDVLDKQLTMRQALSDEEWVLTLSVGPDEPLDQGKLKARILPEQG